MMRKLIMTIALLFIYNINPVKADDNLRVLYADALIHNNVFALFEVEERLANDPSSYKAIDVTETSFKGAKARICENYLDGAESDPHVNEDLLREVRLACNIQGLALKF